MVRNIFLLSALLVCLAVPALAMDAPALSIQRVLITAGLDYSKSSEPVGENYGKVWELKPSINVAYNLGEHLSLVSSYSRGLKSDMNEYKGGFRVRLYRGSK